MKKNLLLLLLIPLCGFCASAGISMLGVKINDPATALKKIKLDVVAVDETMTKYRTANGNDFSVTVDSGKVVYMENDWLHNPAGIHTLFTSFLHLAKQACAISGKLLVLTALPIPTVTI